jgi:hypothetical protein
MDGFRGQPTDRRISAAEEAEQEAAQQARPRIVVASRRQDLESGSRVRRLAISDAVASGGGNDREKGAQSQDVKRGQRAVLQPGGNTLSERFRRLDDVDPACAALIGQAPLVGPVIGPLRCLLRRLEVRALWSAPLEVVLPEVWALSPVGGRADGEEASQA